MSAIIFDLDDTLHRERRWILSGFAALAAHIEQRWAIDRRSTFAALARTVRAGQRHEALQLLCQHHQLSDTLIPEFVQLIRAHEPRLRLSSETRDVLTRLRSTWRIGVLTNGRPEVQARKIAALGLAPMVDEVVYADLYGGKPTYLPFLMVAERLGAEPSQCVFVGDHPWFDVYGARRVGMRTVLLRRSLGAVFPQTACYPDAVITRLHDVETAAARTMQGEHDDVVDDLRACG